MQDTRYLCCVTCAQPRRIALSGDEKHLGRDSTCLFFQALIFNKLPQPLLALDQLLNEATLRVAMSSNTLPLDARKCSVALQVLSHQSDRSSDRTANHAFTAAALLVAGASYLNVCSHTVPARTWTPDPTYLPVQPSLFAVTSFNSCSRSRPVQLNVAPISIIHFNCDSIKCNCARVMSLRYSLVNHTSNLFLMVISPLFHKLQQSLTTLESFEVLSNASGVGHEGTARGSHASGRSQATATGA